MEKVEIRSLTREKLVEEMAAQGEPKFRAGQIFKWLHKNMADDFSGMTNLSLEFRERCRECYCLNSLSMVEKQVSRADGTTKFLFALKDGRCVESVFMRYHHGNSVCISSQVGCRMGCKFCASALGGLERNLTAEEMLLQVYEISRITGERVSNVVVMGTGEPFDNYDHLLDFIHIINDEKGLHISQRNITVSTCGIVEKIRELAEENLKITLAISLHGPDDETRGLLMPIAKKYSIAEILEACHCYFEKTGRRITFEYSLVEGINDGMKMAESLAMRLKGFPCHVNLIPVNHIKERDFRHSDAASIQKFKNILEKYKINVTIRREMGADIDAACGQLRKSYMDTISGIGQ